MSFILEKNAVRKLLKSTHSWELVYKDAKLPENASVISVYDRVFIIGGKRKRCLNKVYELKAQQLTQCTPMISARADCSSILFENKIYVIGGNNTDSAQALSTCEVLIINSSTWEQLPSMTFARISPNICINNSWLYAIGGKKIDTIERFNLNTYFWEICELRLVQPASEMALFNLDDDKVLILGGRDERDQEIQDVWLYDFSQFTMIRQQTLTSPCAAVHCYSKDGVIYIVSRNKTLEYQLGGKDSLNGHQKSEIKSKTSMKSSYASNKTKFTIKKHPNILIIKKNTFEVELEFAYDSCIDFFISNNCRVFLESAYQGKDKIEVFSQESRELIDLLLVLGGDGTVMWASKLFGDEKIPPVISFNFGSLGFMTKFNNTNILEALERILNSDFVYLEEHSRLNIVIKDGATVIKGTCSNEICVDRGANGNILEIEVFLNGEYCTTAIGDGLLIATPCGSTAYSLSAGGSIVHYAIPAILITPICPHSLSFRPLIVPNSVEITLKLSDTARISGWVNIDGSTKHKLGIGATIRIRLSDNTISCKI